MSFDFLAGGDFTSGPFPVAKETDEQFGGSKPGKAATPKPPKPPDPFALIDKQAEVNRVDETNPSGTLRWTKDPVTGRYTQTRAFSPELQGLFDKQVNLVGQDPNAFNREVSDSIFNRSKALLDPVFETQERRLDQKLANQGLPITGEAFERDTTQFRDSKNRAFTDAANQAVSIGADFGTRQRTNEFNQLAALLGGQQTGQGNPIDVTGPFAANQEGQLAQYTASLRNSQQRNQQTQQGIGGLIKIMDLIFG